MGKKLAIKGHPSRGNEVIELLVMMGGSNPFLNDGTAIGNNVTHCYYISEDTATKYISWDYIGPEEIEKYKIFTLEEFLEKYPYKIGDKVYTKSNTEGTIIDMSWHGNEILYQLSSQSVNALGHFRTNELKLYKEEANIEVKKLFGTASNPVETKSYVVGLKAIEDSIDSVQFMQSGKIVAVRFNTQNYEDEVELQLDDYKIEIRDGKTYAVRKKPKYPTTYDECCDVLSIPPYYNLRYHTHEHGFHELATSNELIALHGKLNIFGKLLICRTAYWKIAGDKMGLGKPWNPTCGCGEWGYWVGYDINADKIYCQDSRILVNHLLVFPTEEIRDTFYENFKDLIEQCKELL